MINLNTVYILALMLALTGCDINISRNGGRGGASSNSQSKLTNYTLQEAFPSLTFKEPVELSSPEGGDRVFVVEQEGVIRVFPGKADIRDAAVFLDIKNRVESGGEKGLLGLAFHPDFKHNGFLYVNYTRENPLETVISRFTVSAGDTNKADPGSELVLLTYLQPFENHNGGKIAFGNDGFLYISAGDGGSGGDPGNRAQNRRELLGKILRIDVDTPAQNGKYGIPNDNPYKNNSQGYREEIYAYGMRNAWRFNFDRETGMLWAGDVGQNRIEEIDIIENGGNYGWRIMEANDCYKSDNCDKTGLTAPIWSYDQGSEGRSVTGGYVCHDKNLPALNDKYVYGDYASGNVWALTYSGKNAIKNELVTTISGGLSSFGEDGQRNLYLLSYGPGKIYKIVPK